MPVPAPSASLRAACTTNRSVLVEWNKRDRYGRIVGQVFIDGHDAGLEQVRAGMAWWYREYSKEQSPEDRELYEKMERSAKEQKVGLWRDANPTPPWEWRRNKAKNKNLANGRFTLEIGRINAQPNNPIHH